MAKVLKLHEPIPIDGLVIEIRGHLLDAQGAKTKFDKHRLAAGQKLVELRRRIEEGEAGEGVNWWEWYATQFTRSRGDAEKLMKMARSDDPDAAEEQARAQNAENQRKHRAAYVSGKADEDDEYDVVAHALRLVEKMDDEQLARFDATYREKYNV